MSQFYIAGANVESDVQLCRESMIARKATTIIGVTEKGSMRPYTGIVQSIEDNGQSAPRDKRWRVTILA
jgi:hypothetical protein